VLVGLAHYVNALGHAERVEKAANAKAADVLTAVIDREQVH
jgi:hypothetical protein